jgi:hypothetical protein
LLLWAHVPTEACQGGPHSFSLAYRPLIVSARIYSREVLTFCKITEKMCGFSKLRWIVPLGNVCYLLGREPTSA